MENQMEKLAQKPSGIVKIVLFGPESTGKTTLARALAEHYHTEWVPEYMRTYLQRKWDERRETCSPEDLRPIAQGQMADENRLTAQANGLLFLDTNLLELQVYAEAYYGRAEAWLQEAAAGTRYDLYFLTYIDTPWEPDDLRDKPHEREPMFERFRRALETKNLPYIVLRGNKETRLKKAIQIIDIMTDKSNPFTARDLALLDKRGISPREALRQWKAIGEGKLYVQLDRPAVPGDGIEVLDEGEIESFSATFDRLRKDLRVVKFVPASGAATRMFRDCHRVRGFFTGNPEATWDDMLTHTGLERCKEFVRWAPQLPFYDETVEKIRAQHPGYDKMSGDQKAKLFVEYLLGRQGLHYAATPKGLVLFHRYEREKRTAFEEHLVEAARMHFGTHFTVAPDKEADFRRIAKTYGNNHLEISYSHQSPATDTIMTTAEGEPVRDDEGNLVFRPGGHGALLQNLNIPEADLLFVKNIDNVQKDPHKELTYLFYRVLGGLLLDWRERVFALLRQLDEKPVGGDLEKIVKAVRGDLKMPLIEGFDTLPASQKRKYLHYKLNRPMRVAGMVINRGAPGGGPFWVKDKDGNIGLQIVEKAQIDTDDPGQKAILEASTHFNPVFMALSVRDYKGRRFDLPDFTDPDTGFVTEKTLEGRPVRVYEHPGLWNGAMAGWLTRFVEVPEETFSPVKEFYDLLKPPHV